MSGAYRVELATSNRAGCAVKYCQDNNLKIKKGELRQGVTVQFKEHTTWKWRHWGCVTPSVIHNWKITSGGDMELVDGYDELPAPLQEKVERAFEQGHVDDDDWTGDVEMNRYDPQKPNQGMRMTKAMKKAKGGDSDDDEEEPKK
ncbi:uncharacterized protein MYCGRDRAFT_103551, partial [Zymoseptoria tritici IPO323]